MMPFVEEKELSYIHVIYMKDLAVIAISPVQGEKSVSFTFNNADLDTETEIGVPLLESVEKHVLLESL
jgi:hypothetical protein